MRRKVSCFADHCCPLICPTTLIGRMHVRRTEGRPMVWGGGVWRTCKRVTALNPVYRSYHTHAPYGRAACGLRCMCTVLRGGVIRCMCTVPRGAAYGAYSPYQQASYGAYSPYPQASYGARAPSSGRVWCIFTVPTGLVWCMCTVPRGAAYGARAPY
ncbi:hypothetical protein JB92DRAFT_1843901 [Gautieria morchelliformis]|nr:hypothetical protein JB92DRAFT_1843901 [Gautieria morchelliformis]